ncbi:hypothetical protein P152DRAFT_461857 [Eremomyces bilateralis CBS 781.70]|uniref:VOC domain-containing protein n=1 Tax=Eremomyces bilateralis CBS 781.70 TaxID=1392243 RepID=A0A6G1FTD4_9PEZI|nr:uncharacterized protein P152DRAFT_461857 [Eremomyces bilateralis CBS 781.70]KAF1808996.1 hypothetical protein P152DRAFT_461857 [Eremomyces bilateralis CBS 781.70]
MPRTQPVLGAVGIAVSNLNVSMDFYTKVLPFVDTGVSYDLPQFLEKVVALPAPNSGSSVVLMQWKTPRNTTNIPVKLALYVEDVHESMEKVRAYGNEILLEAGSGRIGTVSLPTGMARDPDGYILEFNPLSILSPKQAL